MKKRIVGVILFCMLVLGGCASQPKAETETGQKTETQQTAETEAVVETEETAEAETQTGEIRLTDQAGREVVLEKPAEKIVSCYYITTYAALALDLEDSLIGIESKADSRDIYHMAAPELLELPSVGTLKEFNVEAAAALNPDLVIMPKKLMDQAQTLEELGIPVLVVYPESQSLLEEMLQLIAAATGTEEKGNELLAYYEESFQELEEKLADVAEEDMPSVYMARNSTYLAVAANEMYQSTLIDLAKGKNAAEHIEGDYWTDVSYEDILAMNPDVIIVPAMAEYSVEDVLNDAQLQEVTAVKNKAVYQMPEGIDEWDSPIPSGILGVYWTASVLHEDLVSFDEVKEKAVDFYERFYGFALDSELITK